MAETTEVADRLTSPEALAETQRLVGMADQIPTQTTIRSLTCSELAKPCADSIIWSKKRMCSGRSGRLQVVQGHCLNCAGGTNKLVAECPGEFVRLGRCPLWPWRFGVTPRTAIKYGRLPADAPFGRSLTKAIRQHCLQCCGGDDREVALCPSSDCRLWPWRFGVRPGTAKAKGRLVGSDRRQCRIEEN